MGPLHLEDLLKMCCPCGSDTCTLRPSSVCHPRAGLTVVFRKNRGLLELACRKCDAPVAEIVVAQRHTHEAAEPLPPLKAS